MVEVAQQVRSAPVRHGRRASHDAEGTEVTADLSASFQAMEEVGLEVACRLGSRLGTLDETLDLSSSFSQ